MKYATPYIFNATVENVDGKKIAKKVKVFSPVGVSINSHPHTARFYAAEMARNFGVYIQRVDSVHM